MYCVKKKKHIKFSSSSSNSNNNTYWIIVHVFYLWREISFYWRKTSIRPAVQYSDIYIYIYILPTNLPAFSEREYKIGLKFLKDIDIHVGLQWDNHSRHIQTHIVIEDGARCNDILDRPCYASTFFL